MKSIRSRCATIIVAAAAAVALAACSAFKLGYSTFPDLAYWWLDGYVDFTEEQAPQVRQELARLHAWHRQQELPHFIELLARLEAMVPGPISAEQACALVAQVQGRLQHVADAAEPAVLALAASLQPEQLLHLRRKYESNNRKFRREWLEPDPQARHDKRMEQVLERLEMLYGRLQEPQRAVLRQRLAQSAFDPQRILAERRRRQDDLLQTLRQLRQPGQPPEIGRALLRGYLQRVQHAPDPAYRAWQQRLREESCSLFEAVHASTTAQQREQAAQRLRGYQRDLRELAGSA